MTNLKPFDLEAAKRGEKVVYLTHVDGMEYDSSHLVGVSRRGSIVMEDDDGTIYETTSDALRMAPAPRTVWRVIYRAAVIHPAKKDFSSLSDARVFISHIGIANATDPFEIEVQS